MKKFLVLIVVLFSALPFVVSAVDDPFSFITITPNGDVMVGLGPTYEDCIYTNEMSSILSATMLMDAVDSEEPEKKLYMKDVTLEGFTMDFYYGDSTSFSLQRNAGGADKVFQPMVSGEIVGVSVDPVMKTISWQLSDKIYEAKVRMFRVK